MLLNLTDLSNESLQSQIVRQIRAQIISGELLADTSLPSIRELARTHHVSVITVQRAYETLEYENLIHSRRGKGFFVSELPKDQKKEMALQRLRENLERPLHTALAEGLSANEIHISVDTILSENKNEEFPVLK
ncbi:GntR family transcriptional regulator [candidate division KSB1 bacterium]|nr:GntR family transcriptional regulator [candidate division KSB1 bacterium]